MDLDFSRCRLPLFQHQREDVAALIAHPWFFIASQMRTGKSAIVVVATQFLFEAGLIDRVVVVAPAPVRDVWADQTLGEIAKHSFLDVPARITEFHARIRAWQHGGTADRVLEWYVTNYEFIRSKMRLEQLLPACKPKTLLVVDESSFVKNYAVQQTKAVMTLRHRCGRVVLLNGTPIFHSPLDLFSQGNLLHPSVLDCKYITLFRARYAVQAPVLGFGGKPLTDPRGKAVQKIVDWVNLDDLQRRFAPITVRRLQKDCMDLPPKLDPVMLTATLNAEWKAYKAMRDELVVWLSEQSVVMSATAAVKVLRLSQITSGFLSGVERANVEPADDALLKSLTGIGLEPLDAPSEFMLPTVTTTRGEMTLDELAYAIREPDVVEVGRAKLDTLLWFLAQQLEADPQLKVVVWCRFRAELFRMIEEVRVKFPQFTVGTIVGGQKKAERLHALSLLKPETSPNSPVFVGGIEGTGSFGLDMCAAHTCVTMSSGYSPGRVAQTLDRVYGPGQRFPIAYFTILAAGPLGQRTIDHQIEVARRNGDDLAQWTTGAWIKALTEEE